MSSGKRQKKRKRQSPLPPLPPLKSKLAQRLQRIRSGAQQNLWTDDDDSGEEITSPKSKQLRTTNNYASNIELSDPDEESLPSRNTKSRKKLSRNHDENIPTNIPCLICSIVSQLSSYNCCGNHLSILKRHSNHQTQRINAEHLPERVMIVPITDEILQRYLDPQQIHQLRTNKRKSSVKSVDKSTMTRNPSEMKKPVIRIPRLLPSSFEMNVEPLASTIVVESTCEHVATHQPDISTPIVVSSSTIDNIENQITNDKSATDDFSIDIITIDDTPTDNSQVHANKKSENDPKKMNPWDPIHEDIDRTLEQVLNQIDARETNPLEFTPATARRTNTEVMAALLPKLALKEGRFRRGRPISNRTLSNAANEYRPSATTSSTPQSSSVTTQNHPPSTPTNIANKSSSSQTTKSIIDGLETNSSDHLLTQDNTNQTDLTSKSTTTITQGNQNLPLTSDTNVNSTGGFEIDRTNEEQHITSSTINERATPIRMSYRMNPDGTRVSISRPLLSTSRQSPLLNSLRRTSTDVTPFQSNQNKM